MLLREEYSRTSPQQSPFGVFKMASPDERVIVLDVFDSPSDYVLSAVPGGPSKDARFLRLSGEFSTGEGLPHMPADPIPFELLQSATHDLVARARSDRADHVRWFVAGRAPLPLFAQVGFELSAWAGSVTLLNQRKEGEWDVLRVGDIETPLEPFFVPEPSRSPSDATGRVAIFVSTLGNEPPKDAIRSYLRERSEPLSGVIGLRTAAATWLTVENAPRAAHELAQAFSAIAAEFPHCLERGIALFIAGPAPLAFLAGRAANPRIVREVWIPNHRSGEYEDAVFLPVLERSRPLDTSEGAQRERAAVLESVGREPEFLKTMMSAEHLTVSLGGPAPVAFIEALRGLDLPPQPESESSRLSVPRERSPNGFAMKPSRGALSLGDALCDALRGETEALVRGVAAQLIVHELFHGFQSLTYGNYREIGRAGVVLEEIDYRADAFAVQALANLRAAHSGTPLVHCLREEIHRVIQGIETFDRAEQGPRLERLYERRVRRYLIWWLQLARAKRLRSIEDVEALFRCRLVVELAPLAGRLDGRGDKLVMGGRSDTALLMSVDGTFRRIDPGPNITPAAIVDYIREFRSDALAETMERVVEAYVDELVPWTTTSG